MYCFNTTIHPSIYVFINQSIHQSLYLLITLFIHQSSIFSFIHQSFYLSITLFINHSIYQSLYYQSLYLSINHSIYPSFISPSSRERRISQQEKQSNFAKMKTIPIISISSDTEMITDDGSLSPR